MENIKNCYIIQFTYTYLLGTCAYYCQLKKSLGATALGHHNILHFTMLVSRTKGTRICLLCYEINV